MKHFAENLGLSMKGKEDEEDELPTPPCDELSPVAAWATLSREEDYAEGNRNSTGCVMLFVVLDTAFGIYY